ncbi:MAG: DUF1573 domain-containing protein [Verrucomicrobia bacterium]|nr:DUF1573 domain-containing protein [Verrucomicrobiota bacterium]
MQKTPPITSRFPICVILFVFFIGITQYSVHAAPQIHVDQAVHDFGAVRVSLDNQSVEHIFKISNHGDEDLIIHKVNTSCGCTTTKLSKNTLAPGDSVELTASLSLKGRRGPMAKSITVTSNDSASPSLNMQLIVDAQRDVDVSPAFVNFRIDSKQKSALTQSIVITFDGSQDYHLTAMTTNTVPFCSIEHNVVREGKEVRINLKLLEEAVQAQPKQNATLTLHTDHPDYATIEVPVSYYTYEQAARPPVSIYPQIINVPAKMDAGTTFKQALLVRSNYNTPITVLEITPPGEHIAISTQSVNSAYIRYQIEFTQIDPEINGKTMLIRTQTQDRDEQTFNIPINIR